jgi:hypothetical protein
MTHKEKMNWLKENDPITYSEMNSNPTGSDSDTSSEVFIAVIIMSVSAFLTILVLLMS